MSCRGAQAYRGQWTRCAIVLNINIDADPDVLASLALSSAINGLVLSRGQGTEPGNEYRKCRSHTFHIIPPQSCIVADRGHQKPPCSVRCASRRFIACRTVKASVALSPKT